MQVTNNNYAYYDYTQDALQRNAGRAEQVKQPVRETDTVMPEKSAGMAESGAEVIISPEGRQMWEMLQTQKAPVNAGKAYGGKQQLMQLSPQMDIAECKEMLEERETAIVDKLLDYSISKTSYDEDSLLKEALTKEMAASKERRELEQIQQKERRQRVRDAKEAAAQEKVLKKQDEVVRKGEDLIMMVDSFEKTEDAKKDKAGKESKEKDQQDGQKDKDDRNGNAADKAVLKSASQLEKSTVQRKVHLKDTLENLDSAGARKVNEGNAICRMLLNESADIRRALDSDDFSMQEKINATIAFAKKKVGKADDALQKDVRFLKENGLYMRQTARDMRIEQMGSRVMLNTQNTVDELREIAADAVISHTMGAVLERTKEELDERVQEKLDERDGIAAEDELNRTNPEEDQTEEAKTEKEAPEEEGKLREEVTEETGAGKDGTVAGDKEKHLYWTGK